jgi:hypothetical protein
MHRRTLMKLGVSVAVLLPLREVPLGATGPGDFPPEAVATLLGGGRGPKAEAA